MKFLKHFICGGAFGAFSGLILALGHHDTRPIHGHSGVVCVAGMALILGILAAIYRARFWEDALGWLFWS
jgi:hypothetical protein